MTITICASLEFVEAIQNAVRVLQVKGHIVLIPKGTEMIMEGKLTVEEVLERKEKGNLYERTIEQDAIRLHYENIKASDAILVLNIAKKGIQNYIGPNAFLEIGFAHVLNKKIFLLNDIPDMPAKDEIRAMQPVILHGNILKMLT